MYKNKNKFKLLIVPFLLLMVTFFGINSIKANEAVNDGGSSGGFGLNSATCVYYPVSAEKGVKLTLTYSPRNGVSRVFEDIKSSSNLIERVGAVGDYTYSYVTKTRLYSIGTTSYSSANFVENDGLACPTLYSRQKEDNLEVVVPRKIAETGQTVDVAGFRSILDFSTGSDVNDGTYVKLSADEKDSKVIFDKDVKTGVCVFTLETRVEHTQSGNAVTVKDKYVNITMDRLNPEFGPSNIIATASNSANVIISKQLKVENFFKQDGGCNTNFKGYCERTKNCYLFSLNEEEKFSTNVSMDGALNRSPSEIITHESTLKANFKLGFSTCNDLRALLDFADEIYGTIILFVIIGLIIFGMLDFGQAVMSDKPDANQKAFKKFKTRAIIAILIIILPGLLNFTFSLFTEKSEAGYTTCIPRT